MFKPRTRGAAALILVSVVASVLVAGAADKKDKAKLAPLQTVDSGPPAALESPPNSPS